MRDHRFTGPEDRLHFPHWTKGCWRGRPSECCSLCYLRLLGAALRRWVR